MSNRIKYLFLSNHEDLLTEVPSVINVVTQDSMFISSTFSSIFSLASLARIPRFEVAIQKLEIMSRPPGE